MPPEGATIGTVAGIIAFEGAALVGGNLLASRVCAPPRNMSVCDCSSGPVVDGRMLAVRSPKGGSCGKAGAEGPERVPEGDLVAGKLPA